MTRSSPRDARLSLGGGTCVSRFARSFPLLLLLGLLCLPLAPSGPGGEPTATSGRFPPLSLAFAAEAAGVASEDLPAVRVEGVRPLEEGNTPGTVTVLVPEATEGEGKTVADLLEQSAGVHVVRLRGRGGYTVALVRGGTASQTAVYVDSVLVNSASESAVDLSTLPVSSVKRIEIYRGFIPARFGVSGMGAVISLTTRKPEGPEAALLAEGESYGTYRLAGRYGNELGDGQYRLDFSLAGSRGDFSYHNDNGTPWNGADDYEATRQNNAWNEQDLLFRWENPQGWSLRAEYYAKDAELPREASGNDRPGQAPGAEQDIRTLSLSLGREGTFDG